jgi:hypothetical protein
MSPHPVVKSNPLVFLWGIDVFKGLFANKITETVGARRVIPREVSEQTLSQFHQRLKSAFAPISFRQKITKEQFKLCVTLYDRF